MKILVVSLLRLGDNILALPLAYSLKRRYPGSEIHFLMNEQFLNLAPLLSHVDVIHKFDRKSLQEGLVQAERPLFEPYYRLKKSIEKLNAEEFDMVINVSHTKLSGWICGMVNANERLGLAFNSKGQASFGSPWFSYLNDHVASGGKEIFHFSDIFRYGASVGSGHGQVHLDETSKGRAEADKARDGCTNYILVQALTSDEKKDWDKNRLVKALKAFSEKQPDKKIILMGAPFECKKLNEIYELCNKSNVKVSVALVSLEAAYSLLKKSELLVTGDTSIKHLASGAKIKVLEISLGSSDYRKTGYYSEKGIIVQPKTACAPCAHSSGCTKESHLCGDDLDPELIARLMDAHICDRDQDLINIAKMGHPQFEVFKTGFSNSGEWVAKKLFSDKGQKDLLNRFNKMSLKFVLDQKHKEHLADISSMSMELREFLERPGSSKSINLKKVEGDLLQSESDISRMRREFQLAIRTDGVNSELSRFKQFLELHGVQVENNIKGFAGIRKIQMELDKLFYRNEIEIKLTRSMRNNFAEKL